MQELVNKYNFSEWKSKFANFLIELYLEEKSTQQLLEMALDLLNTNFILKDESEKREYQKIVLRLKKFIFDYNRELNCEKVTKKR